MSNIKSGNRIKFSCFRNIIKSIIVLWCLTLSLSTSAQSITDLPLNTPISDTISPLNKEKIYRILIGGGEHLFLFVEKSNAWASRLDIMYSSPPKDTDYDDTDGGINDLTDQSVEIQSTQMGVYFVRLKADGDTQGGEYKVIAQTLKTWPSLQIGQQFDENLSYSGAEHLFWIKPKSNGCLITLRGTNQNELPILYIKKDFLPDVSDFDIRREGSLEVTAILTPLNESEYYIKIANSSENGIDYTLSVTDIKETIQSTPTGKPTAIPTRTNRPTEIPIPTSPPTLPPSITPTIAITPTSNLCGVLLSSPGKIGVSPQVATDPFGNAHIIWKEEDGELMYTRIDSDLSNAPSIHMIFKADNYSSPRIATDSDGNAHIILWLQISEKLIYFKVSNGKDVESHTLNLFGGADCRYGWPSISIDPTTNLPVIAVEFHIYWPPVEDLYVPPPLVNLFYPHFGNYGIPYDCFWDGIFVVKLNKRGESIDDSRWIPFIFIPHGFPLKYSNVDVRSPDITVDSDGIFHCVWMHKESEWGGFSIAYRNQHNDNWFEISNHRNVLYNHGGPKICANDYDYINVVWSTENGDTVWQNMLSNGLTFQDDTVINPAGAITWFPSISASQKDVAAWTDKNTKQIFYKVLSGDGLVKEVSCSGSEAMKLDISLFEDNYIDCVWQEKREDIYQVYHKRVAFIEPSTKPPVALFTHNPDHPFVNNPITFIATESHGHDAEIVSFKWDFGDGNSANGEIVNHVYENPGYYNVKLTVKDENGLEGFAVLTFEVLTNQILVGNILIRGSAIHEIQDNPGVFRVEGKIEFGAKSGLMMLYTCTSGSITVNTKTKKISNINLSGNHIMKAGSHVIRLSVNDLNIHPIDPDNPLTGSINFGVKTKVFLPNSLSFDIVELGSKLDLNSGVFDVKACWFDGIFNGLQKAKFVMALGPEQFTGEIEITPFGRDLFSPFSFPDKNSFIEFGKMPKIRMNISNCGFEIENQGLDIVKFFDGGIDVGLSLSFYGVSTTGLLKVNWCGDFISISGDDLSINISPSKKPIGIFPWNILKTKNVTNNNNNKKTKFSPVTGVKINVDHAEFNIPKSTDILDIFQLSGKLENLSLSIEVFWFFYVQIFSMDTTLEDLKFTLSQDYRARIGNLIESAKGISVESYLDLKTGELFLHLREDVDFNSDWFSPVNTILVGAEFAIYIDVDARIPFNKMFGLEAKTDLTLYGHKIPDKNIILTFDTDGIIYSCEPFVDLDKYPFQYNKPTDINSEFLDWNDNKKWDSGIEFILFSLMRVKCEGIFKPWIFRGKMQTPICWKGYCWNTEIYFTIDKDGNVSWGARAEPYIPQTGLRLAQEESKFVTVFADLYGQSTIIVSDQDDPPVINNGPKVSQSSSTTTIITWNTNEPCDSVVHYGTTTKCNLSVAEPAYIMNHSVVLENLDPLTEYFFYVESNDLTNTIPAVSSLQTFTTSNSIDNIPPTISNEPLITLLSETSVQIEWETSEPTSAIIEYGTAVEYVLERTRSTFADNHIINIADLVPDTIYYYRILITDAAGNGPISFEELSFKTASAPDTTPPLITINSKIEIISNTSTRITWETNEPANSIVNYGIDSHYGNRITIAEYTLEHSITLQNLLPGFIYHYKVGSTDASGNGPVNSDNDFFEMPSVPEPTYREGFSQGILESDAVIIENVKNYEQANVQETVIPSLPGSDGYGLVFEAGPNEGTLCILRASVSYDQGPVVISAWVRTDSNDCSIGLVGLNSPIDGQLGYTLVTGPDVPVGEWKKLFLLYDPPNDIVQPAIQVVALETAIEGVKVYIDNLEIRLLSTDNFEENNLDIDGSFDQDTAGMITNVNGDSGEVLLVPDDEGGKQILLSIDESDIAANIGVFATQLQDGFPQFIKASVESQLVNGPEGTTALVMTNGYTDVGMFIHNSHLPLSSELPQTLSIGGLFETENPDMQFSVSYRMVVHHYSLKS